MKKIGKIEKILAKKKMIFFVLVLLIPIGTVGAKILAPIETQNMDQADFIGGTINVDAPGLVSISAWNSIPTETIWLFLYDQNNVQVAWNLGGGSLSMDYSAHSGGTYKFKIYLNLNASDNGARTISVSSNKQISFMPKYFKNDFGVSQYQPIFYNTTMEKGDLAFLEARSNNINDYVVLYIFDHTGKQVASYGGYGRTSINYNVTTTGVYTVKEVMTNVPQGGTRTLILSSNEPIIGYKQMVFARGSNNALWYRKFDGTWGNWQSLGGVIASDPDAVSSSLNHVDVFVRGTDNALWQISWDGNSWSNWKNLGGILTSGPGVTSSGANILNVYVRGTDNSVWYRKFDGIWSSWQNLGGIITSDPDPSKNLNIVARGTDNAIWIDSPLGGWFNLGGISKSGPSITLFNTANLDVFTIGTDDSLYSKTYDGTWNQWQNLGGILSSDPDATSIENQNHIDVFARGSDNALWYKSYNNGIWDNWQSLGGVISSGPSAATLY